MFVRPVTKSRFWHRPLVASLAFVIAQLSFAQALVNAPAAELGFSEAGLERLGSALEGYVDRGEIAGSVTLVARDGEVAFEQAYGRRDIAADDPMRTDTVFRIASQTKAIASAAALILQEEGRLLITDAVGDYLPEFAETAVADARDDGGYDVVPAKRAITIRDLLTHTSGYDYGDGSAADRWAAAGIEGYYFSDRDEPIRETVRRMAALPASAHPGEAWVYGFSTDILGAVLEVASGQPLDELLASRLFEPLDMTDTHFFLPNDKRDRLATLYGRFGGRLERAPEAGLSGQGAFVDGPRKSFSAGAGLLSTARDYATFLQMILNRGELNGVRVMSRKSVELMSVSHLGDVEFRPGMGFGLGFSVVLDVGARGQLSSLGEYGWGGAYHSTYWVDPVEELVVVYFTQVRPADGLDDHGKLRALVYQSIVD